MLELVEDQVVLETPPEPEVAETEDKEQKGEKTMAEDKPDLEGDEEVDLAMEKLIRSMLRDMLKDYLDKHLADIVKKIAREELLRASRK